MIHSIPQPMQEALAQKMQTGLREIFLNPDPEAKDSPRDILEELVTQWTDKGMLPRNNPYRIARGMWEVLPLLWEREALKELNLPEILSAREASELAMMELNEDEPFRQIVEKALSLLKPSDLFST